MKNFLIVLVAVVGLGMSANTQTPPKTGESEKCKTERENLQSKTDLNVTSGYRNDNSSHNDQKNGNCGVDFSTKGKTEAQSKSEAQKLSNDGKFCQYEKVEGNTQTNYKYQNGSSVGTSSGAKKEGVTGSHIHCQDPKK